jgi:outer membrane protein assembly factor BamD (BamD/ComL family)
MPCIRPLLSAFTAAALLVAGGCAALKPPRLPWTGNPDAPVGTADWWKAHKKKAVFEPGKGHQVAGVDGYFDAQGRPINAKVQKVVAKTDSGAGLLGDTGFKERVAGLKEQVGLGPDQTQAQKDFDEAETLFRREEYADAAKLYKKAYKGWPDSQLEQDAMFKEAESLFYATRYAKATNAYEALIRKYPNSPHLDKVITRQFAIARYWEQYHNYNPNWITTPNFLDRTRPLFDTIGRSMKNYENIRLNDPTGPLADDAIMAMGNSYFLRGRYGDADAQYELLRKDYPRSDHQYDAHILGLQCKLRKYQGPSYDGTPLEESQVLVKQLKVQFSGQLDADQRDRLAEVDAMLKKELATRDFQMAEHFDGIEEYGSARMYYARVMKEYPQTPLAEQSKIRLAEIGGEPERPTSMFEPVLELLPENSERTKMATVPLVKPTESPIGPVRTDIMTASGESGAAGQGGGSNDPTIRR